MNLETPSTALVYCPPRQPASTSKPLFYNQLEVKLGPQLWYDDCSVKPYCYVLRLAH
jgi:hypothetical protein